jgi:hypothetical protein
MHRWKMNCDFDKNAMGAVSEALSITTVEVEKYLGKHSIVLAMIENERI